MKQRRKKKKENALDSGRVSECLQKETAINHLFTRS